MAVRAILTSKWRVGITLLGGTAVVGLVVTAWLARLADPASEARAVIARHCVDCHNPAERAGELVLSADVLTNVAEHAELAEAIARKMADRTMPPPDRPRPEPHEYASLQDYLETELDRSAALRPDAGPLPRLRRLTRTEYRNSIRDLLALSQLPAELNFDLLLPADNASSGFDNIAELLYVSPSIMERYIDTATKISRLAIGDLSAPPLVNRHAIDLQLPQDAHLSGLPIGTRGGVLIESHFPADAEYDIAIELAGSPAGQQLLEVLIDGTPMARVAIEPGAGGQLRTDPIELRFAAKAGPATIGVTFVEHSEAFDESTLRVRRRGRGALLAVDQVTIAGPYLPISPGQTPSRERIFVCYPETSADEMDCAVDILSTLARRAYRRPIGGADLDDLLPFFEAGRAARGFESGIQRALERLLISPQFLYRIEQNDSTRPAGAAQAISDLELASRVSFFLWSSIPDDELLATAEAGRLRSPGVLESEVERMLADPRAESLVSNFATQWLFLRDIQTKDPDLFLYRDYDQTLRDAFVREIELFIDSVFRSHVSVLELITADYTFVNQRLAEHYQIPNIVGSHFRRIDLPSDSPRAGLLGKGGILTLTSYSTRTSPVLRGKYVLDNLLAAPPPAPPPDVPSLVTEDQTDGAALSMRDALARHRADPACAGCHRDMDAIGFALENFDATGQWRDWDAGSAVDARSELGDGTAIEGIDGLREYLSRNPQRFVRAFTEKLLMYAIGRNVQYYDAPAVRAIVRDAQQDNFAFASIVTGIVESVPFQMRNAEREDGQ